MPRFEDDENAQIVHTIKKIVGIAVAVVLLLIIIVGLFYTIGAGERGIVLTWGKPSSLAAVPGLHMKVPIAQSVVKMTVQTQKYETDASAASSDLQIVTSKIAVNYHLTPESVPALFADIGVDYSDRVIAPATQESVKASTALYTAEQLITNRPAVKDAIKTSLHDRLLNRGIIVEDVNIVDFDFSPLFNDAIEAKVTAEQQKLKAQNDLQRIQVEAQQTIASAEGQRNASIALAEGQAQAIAIINAQLRNSPSYVQFLATQKWNGILPNVMSGVLPFVDVSRVGSSNGTTVA